VGGKLFQTMNEPTDAPEPTTTDGEPEAVSGTRIQSVARASQILFWVASQPHGATAKEIAAAQGLALPTTYHLLNTLVDQGMLAKGLHRHYILGRGVAILAEAHLRGKAVPDTLLNALREVARRTDETAYLADWGGYDIRVLASIEGRQTVRVAEVGGGPYEHGHARANGKVLLAFAPPEVREAYLRAHPLVPVTKATISSPRAFEKELEEIRERGYAYDHNEFVDGVSCVAAPVRVNDHVIAALGLSVPTPRFEATQPELTATLLDVVSGLETGDAAVAEAQ
jgi:IclR family transcriptional regulator, acetate operon repressor